MPLLEAVPAGEPFYIHPAGSATIKLRENVIIKQKQPLESNTLLALTLNDAACDLGRGMFYWLPSPITFANRRWVAHSMLKEDGLEVEEINSTLRRNSTSANLLFLPDILWTELERQRWKGSDAVCRRNISQGQLNWHNGSSVLVLPVYFDTAACDNNMIKAGPRLDAHDGAMILFRSSDGDDGYRVYLDTLNGFRGRQQKQSSGVLFRRKITDDTFEGVGDARLTYKFRRWMKDRAVLPNTLEQLVAGLERMSRDRPELLELWDSAIDRTYMWSKA